MKKICVALGVLFMAIASAFADDNELVKTATSISTKSSGEISTDSIYWKFPGSVGLNVNQAYFSDYCMEGTGLSVSTDAFLNLNANYKKNRVKWDNSFSAKYGMIFSSEFTSDEPVRKNMDEFGLYSKFGYKMAKYWYASALASLESQFTPSYKYELSDKFSAEKYQKEREEVEKIMQEQGYYEKYYDELFESKDNFESKKDTISAFFAPGSMKVSLGFDYVPNKKISFFMSPLTARFTFCRLNELAANYGMEKISEAVMDTIDENTVVVRKESQYKKSRSELGAYAILRSDFDITKNLHFFSSLEGFFAYNKAISVYTDDYREWYGKKYEKRVWDRNKSIEKNLEHDYHASLPYDIDKESIYVTEYDRDKPGKDIKEFVHGWSFKWKLELMAKLTKYINVSVRTQLKYDNAEMKSLKDRNYGLPYASIQFWEATSIGIAYQF
ncbi:MAG: DUF3078 domain-containing protein [Paludibacteraceae bacterium]|nr:DUF3078 domain-containing protein [Paludibacteraceae bacterium]